MYLSLPCFVSDAGWREWVWVWVCGVNSSIVLCSDLKNDEGFDESRFDE
jgi:hypothetical protein